MSINVCVVTGSRAEYGLLYWLMKEIIDDNSLNLQIIVTGMHLSERYGNTFQQIEEDGFSIDEKVKIPLESDSEVSVSKSIGYGIVGFSEALSKLNPDLLLVLGDRYEIFSAVIVAMINKIPVAHIHGGESTVGAFDESIRHSITKMSHLHFTATEIYQNRVIQLGENPNKVFNVGTLGIEQIKRLNLLPLEVLEEEINFNFGYKNIIVTFHPVTLDQSSSEIQFKELLKSIDELKNTNIIFTMPNNDPNGRIIIDLIEDYVSSHANTAAFKSMGQLKYLSTLQFVDAVVGNSSSGIIEAPSFKIGTIDIGDRQQGRIKADSVIECLPNSKSISAAFKIVLSDEFKNKLSLVANPYDSITSFPSKEIVKIIKKTNLKDILKKTFFDIKI